MSQNARQIAADLLATIKTARADLKKRAFIPMPPDMQQPGGQQGMGQMPPPGDSQMGQMGGAPPQGGMDPSQQAIMQQQGGQPQQGMMPPGGGGMPPGMDPSMGGGGMPPGMDPSMGGGQPQQPGPPVEDINGEAMEQVLMALEEMKNFCSQMAQQVQTFEQRMAAIEQQQETSLAQIEQLAQMLQEPAPMDGSIQDPNATADPGAGGGGQGDPMGALGGMGAGGMGGGGPSLNPDAMQQPGMQQPGMEQQAPQMNEEAALQGMMAPPQ